MAWNVVGMRWFARLRVFVICAYSKQEHTIFNRSTARQKWRGAHLAVLAGTRGDPHQLRAQDLRQVNQSAGLPSPAPAA